MPRMREQAVPINEEQPYSTVVVTMQIRILHEEITRSRVTANIYLEPTLEGMAKKELSEQQFGNNEDGTFVVNFIEHWLDLNGSYPRFEAHLANPAHEDLAEMNKQIAKSVNWVLELHKRAMKAS